MPLAAGARLALRQAQGDLEQGRKVGPYEIQSALGAGGPPSLAMESRASFGEATR